MQNTFDFKLNKQTNKEPTPHKHTHNNYTLTLVTDFALPMFGPHSVSPLPCDLSKSSCHFEAPGVYVLPTL